MKPLETPYTLSTDYHRLNDLISQGFRIAAWARESDNIHRLVEIRWYKGDNRHLPTYKITGLVKPLSGNSFAMLVKDCDSLHLQFIEPLLTEYCECSFVMIRRDQETDAAYCFECKKPVKE